MGAPTLPLSHIRVLDFSHIAAGPYGTLQLAYFGADIIKVESRKRPDGWRVRDGNAHIEASKPFADHNKNKRSLTLDLKHPEAHKILNRLLCRVDVVVDNFSVGVMDRLGLGHEALLRDFPELIVVTIPGLGSTGPRRHWVTWGPSIMPLSGLTYLWNHANTVEPIGSQTSYPDYVVGAHVAALILAGVMTRETTGEGCWIDISQAEMAASLLAPFYMDVLINGHEASPLGNRHPYYAPHGCYPCRGEDRWCAIAVTNHDQWTALCQLLNREDWLHNPELATFFGRYKHQEDLDAQIASWTRQFEASEVMARCQAVGIPASVVATGEDLAHDPQLAARNFLIDTHHPYLPHTLLPGCPIALSDTPATYSRHAPLLGQDNYDIICNLLGFSESEYEYFDRCGVLS